MIKKTEFISRPQNVFLLFGIVFGILFLLITPPFQVPDEPNHFYRAYQISEGRLTAEKQLPPVLNSHQIEERDKAVREIKSLFAKGDVEAVVKEFYDLKDTGGIGGLLPESLTRTTNTFVRLLHSENKQNIRDMFPLLKLHLNNDNKIFIHFPNTAVYSPVPYLPQVLGIAVGKIFNFSPLMLMYLGRFFNLFAWAILVYLSIKIIPLCKWVFFLLALMPMSLYEAASLSADGFTIGISFFLTSLFIRNAFNASETDTNIPLIFAVSLVLVLSKQAYFLMPLLFLLIPLEKIGTKTKFFFFFFLLNFLNISAIMIWTLKADIYKDIYKIYSFLFPTLSAEKQIFFILSHPLEYCRILGVTFIQNGRFYVESFVGYDLPELLRVSYIIILLFSVLAEAPRQIVISPKQRFIIFMVLFFGVLLVVTLAFIGWTPVGDKIIGGVQGRYFIPLSPLFFLLFYNTKFSLNLNSKGPQLVITSYSLFSLSYTAYVIIERYYIV